MAWSEEQPLWSPLPADSAYIKELCEAIHTLYRHPDKSVRSQAETWLLQQQRLPVTWQAAWTLISPTNTIEEQYFGAHFIHHKVANMWSTINIEFFQKLLQLLFQKLIEYRNGPTIVRRRLAVSLAAFALQAMQGPWPGAVGHSVDYLTEHGGKMVAFEVLVLIPEEFSTITFTSQSKGAIRKECKASIEKVLNLVNSSLDVPEEKEVALKVFNSWLIFDYPVEECQILLDKLFAALIDPVTFSLAVEGIVGFLRQPATIKWPNTVWCLIGQVVRLQPILGEALQRDDMEVCQGICEIALAVTETYTKLILNTSRPDRLGLAGALINMVLECTGVPGHYPVDETFSDTTLQFWFNLGDDIISEEPDHTQRLLGMYSTTFIKLVEVLLRKIQYPSDSAWEEWTDENRSEFETYRREIGDTLLYIQSVVPECLCLLHKEFEGLQSPSEPSWQKIEAVLFLFRSIAETVSEAKNVNDEVIGVVIEALPSLPVHPKISRTALLLCGAYSEWLSEHPDKLFPAVKVLLSHVADPKLSPAAVMAFGDLCRECTSFLCTELSALIEPCLQAYYSPDIKSREKIRLCWALCCLASQVPAETLGQHLSTILNSSCARLKELSMRKVAEPTEHGLVKLELGMINAAFDAVPLHSSDTTSLLRLLEEMWEPLKRILVLWAHDEVIVEDLTKCYWNAILCLGPLFDPYLDTLVDMLCQCFDKHPFPCLLESSAGSLLSIYYADKPDLITSMLQRISGSTFTLFAQEMSEHPDIVEAFFAFHLAALKSCPKIVYLPGSNCLAVLRAALTAITMQEYHTVRSVCRWLSEFVSHWNAEVVQQAIHSNFALVLSELLRGIGTASPSSCVEFLGDVFVALNKFCPDVLRNGLKEVLSVQDFPTDKVTMAEKEAFIVSVLKDGHQKRKLKVCVKEFSLLCRGYGRVPV